MKRKQLVLNATAVGLFLLLAAQLVLGNEEMDAVNKQFPPAITGFSPLRGIPGETVTIIGKNLRTKKNAVTHYVFKVDGIPAEVVNSNTLNQIQIRVPSDASSGLISIEEDSGKQLSASDEEFEVIPGPLWLHQHRSMEARH